jgi:O-antigen/teichoic acid export membrane protein
MELVAEKDYVGISAIYQFLGNGVQMISGSLFYIFAAHIFSPSDLGTIALFIAIVGLFNIVFTLGLNTVVCPPK